MTLTYDTAPAAMLTAAQYADANGLSERTVKRWLADDELPGAIKDERGRWLIPAAAQREPAPSGIVQLAPRPAETAIARHPAGGIDELPSFLTVDQAASILGVSAYAIRKHRDWFDAQPFGANGQLVIPLATIRKIRGS